MNDHRRPSGSSPESTIELRDLDSEQITERQRQRYAEQEARIYDRLDKLSLIDALGETINGHVKANAYLTYVLRRVAREQNADALHVEKYANKSNVEIMMAVGSLLCEARGVPDWRTAGEES